MRIRLISRPFGMRRNLFRHRLPPALRSLRVIRTARSYTGDHGVLVPARETGVARLHSNNDRLIVRCLFILGEVLSIRRGPVDDLHLRLS